MYMICRGLEVWPRISTIKLLQGSQPLTLNSFIPILSAFTPHIPRRIVPFVQAHLSTLDINPFLAPVSRLSQLIHPVASTLYCKVEHGEQRRRNDHQEGVNAVWHFGNRLGVLEVASEMGGNGWVEQQQQPSSSSPKG